MLTGIADGLFGRGYVSGILGVGLGWHGADEFLPQARRLGQRIVGDIRRQRKYPFQKLFSRLLDALFLQRVMKRNVLDNREGSMKGVYEYLAARRQI
jgi:hypothetical protein